MNTAFTKGKFKKWYGSRFYKGWCKNPKRTFEEYINAQSKNDCVSMFGYNIKSVFKKGGVTGVNIALTLNEPYHKECK